MNQPLPWSIADRTTLAAQLEVSLIHSVHDIEGTSIYHYRLDNHDRVAVALPNGTCLLLTAGPPPVSKQERRRRPGTAK